MFLRQQHRDRRIFQHEAQPFRRVAGIQRNICAPRLEDAEKPDDHLQRALDANADQRLWSYAQAAQVVGQLIRPPIQFVVG